MLVRPLKSSDQDAWLTHWRGYIAFYESSVSDEVTAETWRRLLDEGSPIFGLVAEDDTGTVVGIVNCVVHANTWFKGSICYLQDLFVSPQARGQGAGRTLINAVADEARKNGWGRVYWMTKANNQAARALYDKLAPEGGWVRYDLPL